MIGIHLQKASWRGIAACWLAFATFVVASASMPVALAASGSLYVNGAAGNCSDSGTGSSTQPYCTIIRAAQVATAGVTVNVTGGSYAGSGINPAASGIAGAPITFTASPGVTISGGSSAFSISSRSFIVVNGFTITGTSGFGIGVSSSNNITISNNTVTLSGHRSQNQNAAGISLAGTSSSLVTHNVSDNNSDHGIILSGGSAYNTVSFNEASLNAEGWQRNANGVNVIDTGSTGNTLMGNVTHDNEDSGLQFYPGANNGLAINNVSYNNGDHGIDDLNVTGGRLIGNTIYHNCTSGINVEGTSGNYTIENNISVDNAVYPAYNGITCSRRTGNIGIYDSAPASTTVDYNLVDLTTAGNLYIWNNTSYSTPAAMCAAVGQECHGIQGDPMWVSWTAPNFRLVEGSRAIDSANSGVSGESATDADNNPRVDDPATPNTGVGPRPYDDRGAYEFQTGSTDTQPPTVPTGLTATATSPTSVSLAWNASTDNVGVSGYTVYRNGSAVASVASLGYTDTSVAAGTTYTYAVDAYDTAGNHSAASPSVQVTTPSADTQPPTVPTGLATTSVGSTSIGLTWAASTDNFGVAGYTVYRNGVSKGTSATTSFTDTGLTPMTQYSYTVDAFDAAGNHSAQSAPLPVTTAPPPVTFVQGKTSSGGSRHTSSTIGLNKAVAAGDLLVGLFGQWDAAGQVSVADNVNGAWTRVRGTPYSTGKGDVALYFLPNSRASAGGLTITMSAGASTLLTGTVAEYSGVAAAAPLDQVAWGSGTGLNVDSGPTSPVQAGELIFGAVTGNNNLGTVTGGASQGSSFTVRSVNGKSASADVLKGAAGAQDARFNVTSNVTWYAVVATFNSGATPPDTTPPTVPTGLSATNASRTVALSWNASTDNAGVTGYTVYRNGALLATVGGSTLGYTDGAVSSATAYAYAVDAFDAAGNHSAQSTAASITTPDWIAPATPGGLTATNGVGAVGLGWNAATDNVGVTGYTVYRNGAVLTTVAGTVLSYSDASVSAATTYSYAVDAFDAAGNHSAQSSPVSVTTVDWVPPSTPTGLSATNGSGAVALSWSAATDNVGVTGYTVYRGGAVLGTVGGSVLTYSDSSVSPGTTYSYTVDAFDAAGNHSAPSQPVSITTPGQVDTTPPTAPTGLGATAGPPGEVDLAWNASTDDVGVVGYTVYRNGSSLATVSGSTLTYADRTVASATSYTYAVDAYDAAGNHSSQSAAAAITTADRTPPSAPTGLTAVVASSSEIDLSWQAATDNVGVVGYTVYRNGSAIVTLGASTLSYADTGLSHGATYTYTVSASDAAGNVSPLSGPASATTPDDIAPSVPGGLSATATSSTSVSITWSASTDNVAVTGYDVIRDGAVLATLAATTLSYTDTVGVGSTHTYTVDAFDAAGNHSGTPAAISVTTPTSDTTPPSTPGGLTAVAAGSTQVNVSWTASTDNVGVTGYTVYRNGAVLATVGGGTLSYSDGTVTPATTYSYSVDAFDAAGNHSPASSPVSVHVPGQIKFVQGKAVTTGTRVTSMAITFGAVAAGDLLVGWFGQYDSAGQVTVADSVNGAWTRSASTTWGATTGDVALYYLANSAAAPGGLTITVSSTATTYLHGSPAEYSGVAASNPLDQVVIAKGSGTSADSGLTAATGAGELVYGGFLATNGGGTLTPGSSQGVSFVNRAQSSSGSQGLEDIVASGAGQQHAGFVLVNSVSWIMVCAVFRPA